jgi:hypothetical protein
LVQDKGRTCSTNVSTEILLNRSSSRADTPLASTDDACRLAQSTGQPLPLEQVPTGVDHTVWSALEAHPLIGGRECHQDYRCHAIMQLPRIEASRFTPLVAHHLQLRVT